MINSIILPILSTIKYGKNKDKNFFIPHQMIAVALSVIPVNTIAGFP